jgi:hypothetical protein
VTLLHKVKCPGCGHDRVLSIRVPVIPTGPSKTTVRPLKHVQRKMLISLFEAGGESSIDDLATLTRRTTHEVRRSVAAMQKLVMVQSDALRCTEAGVELAINLVALRQEIKGTQT